MDRDLTQVTYQIAPNVWAIITYEEPWKTHINSYVIAKGEAFLLIDTQLKKHRDTLLEALKSLGVTHEKIEQVYCTHRHADHIGNVELFPSRNNWIHLEDYFELDDFSQTLFGHTFTGASGDVPMLSYRQLPGHTPGSVAFFDSESKVCFVGDHLCFFGAPLGSAVGFEAERRAEYLAYVGRWKEQEPDDVKAFAEGIEALLDWPIEILATGHGPILTGEVRPFLRQVLQAASGS